MKDKLIYFLTRYGNDFFHKLPLYSTARYNRTGIWPSNQESEIVKLLDFDPARLEFTIQDASGNISHVCIFYLNDFVI